MAYMLDTNIVSDLVRNPRGRVHSRLAKVPNEQVVTSIVVVAELRYGAARKNSRRLNAQLETILDGLEIISLKPPADRIYGDLRAGLEAIGKPIGANDLLIAAHALSLGYTLVTDNEREFSRISALSIENWLR
jgi:tRNA(fMet)-specific endonuclease VapC